MCCTQTIIDFAICIYSQKNKYIYIYISCSALSYLNEKLFFLQDVDL